MPKKSRNPRKAQQIHCAHTRVLPLAQLRPHPRNSNTHPPEQVKLFARILVENGWRRPITVSKLSGFITKGHGALEAARAAGLTEAPIDDQDYDSEAEEVADLQADNRLARLAHEDEDKLLSALAYLGEQKLDLQLAGYDEGGLRALGLDETGRQLKLDLPGADGDPEAEREPDPSKLEAALTALQAKWKVRRGDLWLLGQHRLLCGDSSSHADVTRLMAGRKARLMCTDPPYGVDYGDLDNSRRRAAAKKKGRAIKQEWVGLENDDRQGDDFQGWLEGIFRAWGPHLEVDAAWYLWHAQKSQGWFTAAAAAAAALQVIYHRQIVWVKPSFILGRGDFHWQHELCFYGWREGHRPKFHAKRNKTTVWEIGAPRDRLHPTQKPLECFQWPMEFSTRPGDCCAEPFSGGGTQILAGEQAGRPVFAMELEPRYIAATLERWANLTGERPRRSK